MPSSFCCFACIDEDEVGIVERFGKFVRLAKPGLQPIMCCLGECMSGSVNTRMRQLDVRCETKTKDDVFVDVTVSVQYVALKTDEDYFNAYYKVRWQLQFSAAESHHAPFALDPAHANELID